MAHLEGAYQQIDKRFADLNATIDARFAQVDARFAELTSSMNARFAQIDDRFLAMDRKIDAFQWRMTSLILVTWITTLLALLLKH